MARQREDRVQTVERYATNLFYGVGQEAPATRSSSSFGATYSNGQARPVTGQQPWATTSTRPVAKVNQAGSAVQDQNWRGDQVAFSIETDDLRNGTATVERGHGAKSLGQTGNGNSAGPAYSNDIRRTLDALLNGPLAAF